ncbi:MAG: aspartate/glutamate racemase family protein [Candidatus Tectimicrobiota bacterium]
MKLAVVAAIGSYTPADLEHKKQSLRVVLRPETQLDMYAADSGVPYVESSMDFYLSEVAVARKIVEVARLGYDAIVGSAFLDNGLDAARELLDIPVVGPAKTTMYMAATLAHRFAVITAAGDLPRHIWAFAKVLGVVDRVVAIPTLPCTVADFLRDESRSVSLMVDMGRQLMDDKGAEAIVLGCGASTGLARRVSQALGIPVLDPGLTAVKYAEMLVDLGLTQSKRAYPYNPRVMHMLAGL